MTHCPRSRRSSTKANSVGVLQGQINIVIAENLTVSSLKREKDDATEVREGYECGMTLTYNDIKEGDIIETYELVEKART